MGAVKSTGVRPVNIMAAVVAFLIALLAGCGGEAVRPSTYAVEAGESSPEFPDPIEGETEAEAVVREYSVLVAHAYETGSTDLLKQFSGRDCETCNMIIGSIESTYRDGGHFVGNPNGDITSALPDGRYENGDYSVCAKVERERSTAVWRQGEEPNEFDPGTEIAQYRLARESDQWLVEHIRLYPVDRPPARCAGLGDD